MRADFGITYDADAFKLIDDLREWGLEVRGVVITRFDDQPAAEAFANKLDRRGVTVYIHRSIPGYPTDVARIVSDEGYGANPYIETDAPLVVVTGPGPNSGKMATCLSQVYHEHHRGVRAGYAKFETFPIWNLPLNHPVNVAYEAATADLRDVNLIDPFHLEAYDERSVNYNRDVEAFPLLKRILEKITGANPSTSRPPTWASTAPVSPSSTTRSRGRPGNAGDHPALLPLRLRRGPRPRGRRPGPSNRRADGGVRSQAGAPISGHAGARRRRICRERGREWPQRGIFRRCGRTGDR